MKEQMSLASVKGSQGRLREEAVPVPCKKGGVSRKNRELVLVASDSSGGEAGTDPSAHQGKLSQQNSPEPGSRGGKVTVVGQGVAGPGHPAYRPHPTGAGPDSAEARSRL